MLLVFLVGVLTKRNRLLSIAMMAAFVYCGNFRMVHAQQPAPDHFEQYLVDLKLDRLVIEHLEHRVAGELDQPQRLRTAQRLLEKYIDKMMASQQEPATADQWTEKSTSLINNYPALNTPRFQFAILQSRYRDEERYFRNSRSVFSDHQIGENFSSNPTHQIDRWILLERDIARFNRKTNDRYQELVTALQVTADDWELSQELGQTEMLLLHADFLLGWTNYFCAVLHDSERAQYLHQSDQHFRKFFQIESRKSLTELSEKWFDVKSDWQVRGLLGLGLCQLGLDHPRQSQHCFDLIRKHASVQMQTALPVWEFNSRFLLGQNEAALRFALRFAERFERENDLPATAQINFWTSVLDASVQLMQPSPDLALTLEKIGLTGLTRSYQAPLIETYLKKRSSRQKDHVNAATPRPRPRDRRPNDFLGNWMEGYLAFYQLYNHLSEPAYQKASLTTELAKTDKPMQVSASTARVYLEKALSLADAQTNDSDLARCRYLLATLDFRERSFELAAQRFNQVAAVLLPTDRSLAAEAQWFAALSLIELGQVQDRYTSAAYAALEGLLRRFPESSFVSRAEFEKLRLNLSALPNEEAIVRLQRIKPNETNYSLALLEIARHRFQRWLNSINSTNSDQKERQSELIEAVNHVRKETRMPIEYQLAATFLVVECCLQSTPMDETRAKKNLENAELLLLRLPRPNVLIEAEYRYYQLQYQEKTRQLDEAAQQANWILIHARDTKFEMPALIFLGKQIERERANSSSKTENWLEESIDVYRRLVEVLGSTQIQFKQSQNAQVALARLAALEHQAQRFEAAEEHYQRLVNDFPNQQRYLHGLATIKMQLQSYESAIPLWRKLSTHAAAGTNEWFESKYNLIYCLLTTDRSAAKSLLQQTIRLGGEIPVAWKSKFAEVGVQLND